jgi:hypothetical protein
MSKIRTRVGFKETAEYELRDSEGNIKPLFQPNRLYLYLMKKGLASPNLTSRLFGTFANRMVISNKSRI